MRRSTIIMAALAAAALSSAASAAPIVSTGTLGDLKGATLFADYDTITPATSLGTVNISPAAGIANDAAPVGSGNFGYVLGGGSGTYSFAKAINSFSLDVGSPDSYNSITFSLSDGFTSTFNILGGTPAARYTFTAGNAANFITSVTLASGTNSFEFDNIATTSVPESATWIMMILGFGLIGGTMRHAHRKSEDRFTRKVRALATA